MFKKLFLPVFLLTAVSLRADNVQPLTEQVQYECTTEEQAALQGLLTAFAEALAAHPDACLVLKKAGCSAITVPFNIVTEEECCLSTDACCDTSCDVTTDACQDACAVEVCTEVTE